MGTRCLIEGVDVGGRGSLEGSRSLYHCPACHEMLESDLGWRDIRSRARGIDTDVFFVQVVELRSHLQSRGLPTCGLKEDLVARLKAADKCETAAPANRSNAAGAAAVPATHTPPAPRSETGAAPQTEATEKRRPRHDAKTPTIGMKVKTLYASDKTALTNDDGVDADMAQAAADFEFDWQAGLIGLEAPVDVDLQAPVGLAYADFHLDWGEDVGAPVDVDLQAQRTVGDFDMDWARDEELDTDDLPNLAADPSYSPAADLPAPPSAPPTPAADLPASTTGTTNPSC